jgi:hypothetical protein
MAIEEYNLTSHSLLTGVFVSGNITQVTEILSVNHGFLLLTPTDQPIYIQNQTFIGWLHDPQNLTTHDSIFDPVTNQWILVKSVALLRYHATVFDVVGSGLNDFIANGALLDVKT